MHLKSNGLPIISLGFVSQTEANVKLKLELRLNSNHESLYLHDSIVNHCSLAVVMLSQNFV